ncbi:MAG: type II toxin-antitoxin system RelB/DinJ family antitoxin [Lactobacillus sp.]|jgi:DNA-damage-inducible protein J|nr:type II toxin-antitoxin system RelB/DinJ family antitoxin [Lactobacillus sp.]MCH3906362.1 type II toxin-antitoxin system RelB/DinJ family antitoxin [Lactobacillus sp.]MCH3990064.1 type II toxin-antitoxin system RelB/DinJ family antitoxin [Lactobacillus sp.]MCH4069222.1 type II toxin-antitoxin system RelB/DinJ family antitoxin [Lactobacillus sp.]MCI1303524.1 type II toxin-antitoxin system RelB/DinJ family antitoxin [Lactobacillus sp.]
MDARVDSRVPEDIKKKAAEELAKHGMSISSFIRVMLSSVANDGLPKYWGIPNIETMASFDEAVDDLKNPKLKGATSYDELEKLLDE